MRTIETTVYKFSELSEDAKEKAISNYREGQEFFWGEYYLQSVKLGLKHFGFSLKNYSIDWDNINRSNWSIESDHTDEVSELSGARLFTYLNNNGYLQYFCKYQKKTRNTLDGNCPFTGFCADEDFLDNIREFCKKPNSSTFTELMEDAVHNCINTGCKDWEHQISDEGITEEIEINEREFTEDGEFI